MDLLSPDLAKKRKLLFPWEQPGNQFLADIFGDHRISAVASDPLLDPHWEPRFLQQVVTEINDHKESLDRLARPSVASPLLVQSGKPLVSRTAGASVVPFDEERHVALTRWRLIICTNPAASRVGLQLLAADKASDPEAKAAQLIEDTFRSKSTATLESRAGAILSYIRWANNTLPDPELCGMPRVFPLVEEDIYDYVCDLRINKAAPTKISRFREAVAFCFGVLGLHGAEECMASRRIEGVAYDGLSKKSIDRQAEDFLVSQVELFERSCISIPEGNTKVFIGFVTALIHWRARLSDTHHCCTEPFLDTSDAGEGFIEMGVVGTKTSHVASRMTKQLPLVGSATGVTGTRWAEAWLNERSRQGLDSSGTFLMPSIEKTGSFSSKRMTAGEFNILIREFLRAHTANALSLLRISSHSCKHTILAWSSKAGLKLSVRRTLGHHLKTGDGSVIVYSRDSQAGPLREMVNVLQAIRDRKFFPDRTRSGRWVTEEGVSSVAVGATFEEDDAIFSTDPEYCMICGTTTSRGNVVSTCSVCSQQGCTRCFPSITDEETKICKCFQCFHKAVDEDIEAASESSSGSEMDEGSEEDSTKAAEAVARVLCDSDVGVRLLKRAAGKLSDKVVQHRTLKTLHLCTDFLAGVLACGRKCSHETHTLLPSLPAFPFHQCKDCFGVMEAEVVEVTD